MAPFLFPENERQQSEWSAAISIFIFIFSIFASRPNKRIIFPMVTELKHPNNGYLQYSLSPISQTKAFFPISLSQSPPLINEVEGLIISYV